MGRPDPSRHAAAWPSIAPERRGGASLEVGLGARTLGRAGPLLPAGSAERKGAPVAYEDLPTLANLVGRIEHHAHFGALVTDFTLVRPGALHRANGGFLVLDARKLLSQPFAWDELKRALRSGEIRIESPERLFGMAGTSESHPPSIVCASDGGDLSIVGPIARLGSVLVVLPATASAEPGGAVERLLGTRVAVLLVR